MTAISTALSDFILSLSSFYAASVVHKRYDHAFYGFLLIGIAAGVGTIRFLNIVPIQRRNTVVSIHSRFSWLAMILGIPFLAASFCLKYGRSNSCQLHIVSAIAGIILSFFYPNLEACTRFPSTLGIFSILFQCYQGDNMPGIVGALLYAMSATLIGTSGYIMSVQRVDIFHYCLAIANIALLNAL